MEFILDIFILLKNKNNFYYGYLVFILVLGAFTVNEDTFMVSL